MYPLTAGTCDKRAENLCCAAWELDHRLTRGEAREAKGFAVIQFSALPLEGELNDTNICGDRAFLEGNPATPNPALFLHVDHVVAIAAAAERG